MKTTNRKPTLISMTLGLAFGTTVAYTSAQAYDADYEIASAHDRAKDTSVSASASVRAGGYKTSIVLDEAYHEYQTREIVAFEADLVDLERIEVVAFEVSEASAIPDILPWQVSGTLD